MINIKPKTYNEALRLATCIQLKKYVPELTDSQIEELFNHLNNDPRNKIGVTKELVYYQDANGQKVDAFAINNPGAGLQYEHFVVSSIALRSNNTNNSSGSGCGGCGGCSGNNNNNNNNNNG